MLNYAYSPSTPQVHLPRPSPTISSSSSSPASAPPWFRVHEWGGMPPFLLWCPAASECTPLWGVILRLLVTPPPGDFTTTCPPHVLPSSMWSAWPPGGGTPLGPLASPPSPPNSNCRTLALTEPPPYISYHRPAPLLLSFPKPSRSPPTASALSLGYDTPPSNVCLL